MGLTLAIDFGSTFTKVVAFNLDDEELIGVAQARSTVETDVTLGLKSALMKLEEKIRPGKQEQLQRSRRENQEKDRAEKTPPVKGSWPALLELETDRVFACSSAAGGLKMVVAGLVRELTTKAAQEACLGAGAKLVGTYSNGLIAQDISRIEQINPDIILLAGGTDGGNEETILENARLVAESGLNSLIIVAGNRKAAAKAKSLCDLAGKFSVVVENVLPKLDVLNVEPARLAIRDLFMSHITRAKGLDRAGEMVGEIIMPTPAAVLNAAALLAEGTENGPGLGELVVVDVGGATTDVHSVARGDPTRPMTMVKGLPEPYHKRTVEGDLGLRYNAGSILEIAGERRILDFFPERGKTDSPHSDLTQAVGCLVNNIGSIPAAEYDHLVDLGLAGAAVEVALMRHSGAVNEIYLPSGKCLVQRGKDLTNIKCLIGTGGVFAYGRTPGRILKAGCFSEAAPESLRPVAPGMFVDERYIMFAIGLLAVEYPGPAFRIMRKSLRKVGTD